jgi:hypothetical protein
MADPLQVEQRGSGIDIAKDVGRRLIDRHGARAGHRIGPLSGMQAQGFELKELGVGHGALPLSDFLRST